MGEVIYVGVDVSKKTLDIAVVVDDEEDKRVMATKRISNDLAGYKYMEQWVRGQMHKARCTRMHYDALCGGVNRYLWGGSDRVPDPQSRHTSECDQPCRGKEL